MTVVGDSVNMTSELGVSFHSDNYAKNQIATGKTEQLIYNAKATVTPDRTIA